MPLQSNLYLLEIRPVKWRGQEHVSSIFHSVYCLVLKDKSALKHVIDSLNNSNPAFFRKGLQAAFSSYISDVRGYTIHFWRSLQLSDETFQMSLLWVLYELNDYQFTASWRTVCKMWRPIQDFNITFCGLIFDHAIENDTTSADPPLLKITTLGSWWRFVFWSSSWRPNFQRSLSFS